MSLDSWGCLEAADLVAKVPQMMKEKRKAKGLSYRSLAKQVDVSASALCQMEHGHLGTAYSIIEVLKWLGE